jgi:tricorn protease
MRRPFHRPSALLATSAVFLFALTVARPGAAPAAAEASGTTAPAIAAENGPATRLLRSPTLSQDAIAFEYAGDLWTAPREGGLARQLTTDPGLELVPRFSPDGRLIAFTGQYDGNRDVYVIPSQGGEPRRLTFWSDVGHPSERTGPNNEVLGWTPDGKRVLFRSRHQAWESRSGRLYTVGLEGGLPEPLRVPEGGLAAFSPDGRKIAYNRIFRNFRTWKRYRGGMTQSLWIYDLAANVLERVTAGDANATDPVWIGDRIYFTSDRDKTANLFAYDLAAKSERKLTEHTDYDVRWASGGPGGVVYEVGGEIYLYDTAAGRETKVPIRVPAERPAARPSFVPLAERVTEFGLSPDGKRALFVARGDVLTVPAEKGPTRNLTDAPGSHERGADWSPDGRSIAYLSDRTGEDEIWIAPQDGSAPARRLTTDGHCWRFPPRFSPDSKTIAFADKDLKLFVVDVGSGRMTQADRGTEWEIQDYVWSPDGRWLAYSKQDPQQMHQIVLYSLDTGKATRVTSTMNDSYRPAWDPEGRYLYFLSDRDLNASVGAFDFSYVYDNPTRVFALTLRKDLPSPFAPESDEVGQGKKEEGGEKEGAPGGSGSKGGGRGGSKEKKTEGAVGAIPPIRIDLDGIEDRVASFPIEPGTLSNLRASKTTVYYTSGPAPTLNDGGEQKPALTLHAFDLEKRKDSVLLAGIGGYDLSADGAKVLYAADKQYGIVDAKPGTAPAKVGDGTLKLDGMWMHLDPRAEWRQIFDEAWRLERDFFYVANLHGVDWPAMRRKYGALLPDVAHRGALTYLIGELIGELDIGHAYVGGGDAPKAKSVPIALLGADYALDPASGRYRFARILKGQNWTESRRSPLTEPGVAVSEGAYLLKIDGVDLRAPQTPDEILQNRAGSSVTLTVNDRPDERGARTVTVRPLSDEEDLRYFDRIETNRLKVDAATGGKIGYLHIPNMGGDGLNEFVRQYYPQIRKQGLIVDVRNNGGGFVSEVILERLRRVLAGMGMSRNGGLTTYPSQVFHGPMVCLINHYSASDGDIFPYYFKKYGLGPLVGTRTWGGVVGIRGYSPLVDGGYVTRPEFGTYGVEGQWVIEGHGVDPDIEVDNRDDLVVQGRDPQLEKGIEIVTERIRSAPKGLPPVPPPPVKN